MQATWKNLMQARCKLLSSLLPWCKQHHRGKMQSTFANVCLVEVFDALTHHASGNPTLGMLVEMLGKRSGFLSFHFSFYFLFWECLVEIFVDASLVFDVLGAVGKFERGQRLGEGLKSRWDHGHHRRFAVAPQTLCSKVCGKVLDKWYVVKYVVKYLVKYGFKCM